MLICIHGGTISFVSVLTVKNLEPAVLDGLAQRAAAEGRSVQDLARETLARAAALPAARDQLAALQRDRTPMEWNDFEAFRERRRRAH
jgi:plasmid stability protein